MKTMTKDGKVKRVSDEKAEVIKKEGWQFRPKKG